MRILIYIEPHPIRNSFTQFGAVGRRFATMVADERSRPPQRLNDCDVRLYGNQATLELIEKAVPDVAPFLIFPEEGEEALFRSCLRDWMGGGLTEWVKLIRGAGQISRRYGEVLESVYRRFRFDVVVHWGDNGAVAQFAKASGTARVAMELGCTRPPYLDSVVFDPLGANGSAAPAQADCSSIAAAVGDVWPGAMDLLAFSDKLEARAYERAVEPLSFPGKELLLRRRDKPAAFVPLQLHDDANLLVYSDFDSPADVVSRTLPILADNGFVSVVKPHPASKQRPGGAAALEEARVASRPFRDRVIWLDNAQGNVDNSRLFTATDAVVTVNSSTGFESLFFDKPLCVLGSSVYKPRGVFAGLEEFVSGLPCEDGYLAKVAALRAFFLRSYLVDSQEAFDYVTFVGRIIDAVELNRRHNGNPDQIVGSIYGKYADATVARRRAAMHDATPTERAPTIQPGPGPVARKAIAFAQRMLPGPLKEAGKTSAEGLVGYASKRLTLKQKERIVAAVSRVVRPWRGAT
jgi:hypothetical protein